MRKGKKKELSLDELYELAMVQEEKELREKEVAAKVAAAKAQKEAVDSRSTSRRIGVGEFYKEMQEMGAFGVRLGSKKTHDIELIEL